MGAVLFAKYPMDAQQNLCCFKFNISKLFYHNLCMSTSQKGITSSPDVHKQQIKFSYNIHDQHHSAKVFGESLTIAGWWQSPELLSRTQGIEARGQRVPVCPKLQKIHYWMATKNEIERKKIKLYICFAL